MTILDKLPLAFWEESQTVYKKFKKGSISLEECFDRQRELSLVHLDKIKKNQSLNASSVSDSKIEKHRRAELLKVIEKVKKKREEASEIAKKEAVSENKVDEVKKSGKENFTCEECEKVGSSFSSGILNLYENHINMKHPNYKPFKCNSTNCIYSTHKRGNLHKHTKSTHSKGKK